MDTVVSISFENIVTITLIVMIVGALMTLGMSLINNRAGAGA